MNKKGFLLAEEVMKIILAIIALGILTSLLASLYFNSVNSQKFAKAEASLERIKEVLKNEESTREIVSDITPPGWNLLSFVGEKKPNSCFGKNCLCICSDIKINLFDRQLNECSEKGVCEVVENLENFGEIKIKNPSISVEILESEGRVIIKENGS